MININIDEEEARELYIKKERIKEIDVELVYWDSKELMQRTVANIR